MEKPKQANGITCDPRIQFGAPRVAGTRVTTDALYSMYLGGESVSALADCFGVHEDDVRTAMLLEAQWALETPSPWAVIWEGFRSKVSDLWWRLRGYPQ